MQTARKIKVWIKACELPGKFRHLKERTALT